MLPPRKKRTSLEKHPDAAAYPSITVSLSENSSPDSVYELSILDINTAGIGIACNFQLNVGQRIYFNDGHPEWDLPQYGIVMWTFKSNNRFRAGIKFA